MNNKRKIETSGSFSYEIQRDGVMITDYTGNDPHVTVPSKLGGYDVTAIGRMAFSFLNAASADNLVSVALPDGIKSIGLAAFGQRSKLKRINIPGSLESIDELAFLQCYSLKDIILPGDITEFKGSAAETVWHTFYNKEYSRYRLKLRNLAFVEFNDAVLTSFLRHLPVEVLRCPELCDEIKHNTYCVAEGVAGCDDVYMLSKLFSLYERVPLDMLDRYILLADMSRAVQCKAFLINYKYNNYAVKDREWELTEMFDTDKNEEGYFEGF